jgi:hypothetical protein
MYERIMGHDSLSCMKRRVYVDKFLKRPVAVVEEGAEVIVIGVKKREIIVAGIQMALETSRFSV